VTLTGIRYQAECPNGCGMKFDSASEFALRWDIALHVAKLDGLCPMKDAA
jgi:hypothetical protein